MHNIGVLNVSCHRLVHVRTQDVGPWFSVSMLPPHFVMFILLLGWALLELRNPSWTLVWIFLCLCWHMAQTCSFLISGFRLENTFWLPRTQSLCSLVKNDGKNKGWRTSNQNQKGLNRVTACYCFILLSLPPSLVVDQARKNTTQELRIFIWALRSRAHLQILILDSTNLMVCISVV